MRACDGARRTHLSRFRHAVGYKRAGEANTVRHQTRGEVGRRQALEDVEALLVLVSTGKLNLGGPFYACCAWRDSLIWVWRLHERCSMVPGAGGGEGRGVVSALLAISPPVLDHRVYVYALDRLRYRWI